MIFRSSVEASPEAAVSEDAVSVEVVSVEEVSVVLVSLYALLPQAASENAIAAARITDTSRFLFISLSSLGFGFSAPPRADDGDKDNINRRDRTSRPPSQIQSQQANICRKAPRKYYPLGRLCPLKYYLCWFYSINFPSEKSRKMYTNFSRIFRSDFFPDDRQGRAVNAASQFVNLRNIDRNDLHACLFEVFDRVLS